MLHGINKTQQGLAGVQIHSDSRAAPKTNCADFMKMTCGLLHPVLFAKSQRALRNVNKNKMQLYETFQSHLITEITVNMNISCHVSKLARPF